MYQLLGFPSPFLLVAAAACLLSLGFHFFLPSHEARAQDARTGKRCIICGIFTQYFDASLAAETPTSSDEGSVTFASVLRLPGPFLCLSSVFVVFLTLGYLLVTTSLDLKSLNESLTTISVVFLLHPISHLASVLITGRLLNLKDSLARKLLLFGVCLSTSGAILSGPIYGLPLENSVWLIAARQVLVGVASGAMIQSALIAVRNESVAAGLPDCLSLNSILSSLSVAVNSSA